MERLTAALSDRYRIERELGQGGMATVYLAEDLKHKRKVALKVLKPELAAVLGAERFVQEITTTAALQHPHILPLFDSGTADGFLFYVMPFIDGETLRARLERERQLPVPDAVRITREVASALDYAHRHDVIHRDIKPENILLHDGQAIVADFGIALAVQTAGGPRMTQTGLSLGTPQYMSPEQAMGERAIDARSDVYALGAVSYEMLTGEPPFTGPTVQAIVAKVLNSEPEPISTIRKAVPLHIAAAVHTAIEKLPADRYASAAAFVQALDDPTTTHALSRSGALAAGPAPTRWRTVALAATGVAVAALIGIGWLATRLRPAAGPSEYDVALPDSASLTVANRFDVAPSGDFVVYPVDLGKGRQELWYRSLLDGTTRRIAGTEDARDPAIAPNGQSLAFARQRDSSTTIELLPLAGGPAVVLAHVEREVAYELSWLDDRRLLSVENDGARAPTLDVGGGTSATRPIQLCIGSSPLPDGHSLLCGGGSAKFAYRSDTQGDTLALIARDLHTGGRDSTLVFGTAFRVVDGRYLVYLSKGGDLLAAPVDFAAGRVGRSVRLLTGLAVQDYTGAGSFAFSATGTLVYASGKNRAVGSLVRQGDRSLDTLPVGRGAFLLYAVSHDGTRLAATVDVLDGQELRVYDLTTGKAVVLAKAIRVGQSAWSPTDDRLAYLLETSDVGGAAIYVQTLNSTAAPERVFAGPAVFSPRLWLATGQLVGADFTTRHGMVLHLDRKPVTVDTLMKGIFMSPSPDGRWLLYLDSDNSSSLWLEPFPGNGQRYPVATPVDDPLWLSPTEVVFRTYAGMERFDRVTIFPSHEAPVGPRRRWLEAPRLIDTPGFSSAVTPDGRMIYLQADLEAPVHSLRVVPNWVATMKRAVDEANK